MSYITIKELKYMIPEERINNVINTYIDIKKDALKSVDKMDNGKNTVGSIEWKLRNRLQDDIELLQDIKNELLY